MDAYTNRTDSQILEAVDFIGLNIFPYFNQDPATSVDTAADSFWKAYESMLPLSRGKPVWITETGWPTVDPPKTGGASPGVENAAKYWSKVACELQARCINFWWYILADPPKCRSSASPICGKAHQGRLYTILTAGQAQIVPTLVQLRSHRRRAKSRCYIRRRLVQVLRAPLSVESGGRVTARIAGPR